MANYADLTIMEIDVGPNYNPKSTIGIPGFIKGPQGDQGDPGAIYTPSVDTEGNLSWTNDSGLPNPPTVNIKGPKGDTSTIDGKGVITTDKIGDGLKLDSNGNVCVDSTEEVIQDNTKPITSAGVYNTVGNINALLATI